MDACYQNKFMEQQLAESLLKRNQESMIKALEDIQRDFEKEQIIIKQIEEELNTSLQNHEEEVQLRMKFEQKLNNMHSAHRDLESKYKRVITELGNCQVNLQKVTEKVNARNIEVIGLQMLKSEYESRMQSDKEQINSQSRELKTRVALNSELLQKNKILGEDCDAQRYKIQALAKEVTEQTLKIDVEKSRIDGLKSENTHLRLETEEKKELLNIYELKNTELFHELAEVTKEVNDLKREMINFKHDRHELEQKIIILTTDRDEVKVKYEDLQIVHGNLEIKNQQVQISLEQYVNDFNDTVQKLHTINKARHDIEMQLVDEIERNRSLQHIIILKEDSLHNAHKDIASKDRINQELERENEKVEIEKQAVVRAYELHKKQMIEKINQLNEQVAAEKEIGVAWFEKYEKEQIDHMAGISLIMEAKTDLKDKDMSFKSEQIKCTTLHKQIYQLQEQTLQQQHELTQQKQLSENLDIQLNTQKEILKSIENARQVYIERLLKEQIEVEVKYQKILDGKMMETEDMRSQALLNFEQQFALSRTIAKLYDKIFEKEHEIKLREHIIASVGTTVDQEMMRCEDMFARYEMLFEEKELWRSRYTETKRDLNISLQDARNAHSKAQFAQAELKALSEIEPIAKFDQENNTDLSGEQMDLDHQAMVQQIEDAKQETELAIKKANDVAIGTEDKQNNGQQIADELKAQMLQELEELKQTVKDQAFELQNSKSQVSKAVTGAIISKISKNQEPPKLPVARKKSDDSGLQIKSIKLEARSIHKSTTEIGIQTEPLSEPSNVSLLITKKAFTNSQNNDAQTQTEFVQQPIVKLTQPSIKVETLSTVNQTPLSIRVEQTQSIDVSVALESVNKIKGIDTVSVKQHHSSRQRIQELATQLQQKSSRQDQIATQLQKMSSRQDQLAASFQQTSSRQEQLAKSFNQKSSRQENNFETESRNQSIKVSLTASLMQDSRPKTNSMTLRQNESSQAHQEQRDKNSVTSDQTLSQKDSQKNSSRQQMRTATMDAVRIHNNTMDINHQHDQNRNADRTQEQNQRQRVITGNTNIRKLIKAAATRNDY